MGTVKPQVLNGVYDTWGWGLMLSMRDVSWYRRVWEVLRIPSQVLRFIIKGEARFLHTLLPRS